MEAKEHWFLPGFLVLAMVIAQGTIIFLSTQRISVALGSASVLFSLSL
jgi:hypothetical protein